jgi:hypothetical protein
MPSFAKGLNNMTTRTLTLTPPPDLIFIPVVLLVCTYGRGVWIPFSPVLSRGQVSLFNLIVKMPAVPTPKDPAYTLL